MWERKKGTIRNETGVTNKFKGFLIYVHSGYPLRVLSTCFPLLLIIQDFCLAGTLF